MLNDRSTCDRYEPWHPHSSSPCSQPVHLCALDAPHASPAAAPPLTLGRASGRPEALLARGVSLSEIARQYGITTAPSAAPSAPWSTMTSWPWSWGTGASRRCPRSLPLLWTPAALSTGARVNHTIALFDRRLRERRGRSGTGAARRQAPPRRRQPRRSPEPVLRGDAVARSRRAHLAPPGPHRARRLRPRGRRPDATGPLPRHAPLGPSRLRGVARQLTRRTRK